MALLLNIFGVVAQGDAQPGSPDTLAALGTSFTYQGKLVDDKIPGRIEVNR